MTDKPSMNISHWGEFEAPIKLGVPYWQPIGAKVENRMPLDFFDGAMWRRLTENGVAWLKSNA